METTQAPLGSTPLQSELRQKLAEIGTRDLLDTRIAEYLIEDRGYPEEQILSMISSELGPENTMREIFTRHGMFSEIEYVELLAALHDMETVYLSEANVESDLALGVLSSEQAADWKVLPYSRDDLGRLLVAIADPDPATRDLLIQALPRETIIFQLALPSEIGTWIQKVYDPDASGALAELLEETEGEQGRSFVVREAALDSRIIRIVDEIIDRAQASRASDIHIEPGESITNIRFRVDGVLRKVSEVPLHDTPRVVARIKTMAQMRVDEHRLPQDGRATTRVGTDREQLDLRVVSAPTIYGEQISMRILDPNKAMLSLEELGMTARNLHNYRTAIAKPHGVCLVTGPTGSGKSTTLYSSLTEVVTPQKKLISIEDPVEYRLDGITQMDVSGGLEMFNFATALRSILRSDPDIIMVGEIRDRETAQIAIDAALTGHFLYSTLHTNSALGSVVRLDRIGVDRFLAAEAIEVLVAQRLIRRLCSCKLPQTLDEALLGSLGAPEWALQEPGKTVYRVNPQGCEQCSGQGFYGRTGVHEVLPFSDDMRGAIVAGYPIEELEKIARSEGILSLREDAFFKMWSGDTSIEEMARVVR